MADRISTYQVNLAFASDMTQVKKDLNELQKLLTQVTHGSDVDNTWGINKQTTEALNTASKLQAILKTSANEMGALDMSKFNENLKASGLNITQCAQAFNNLGSGGREAFASLTKSILAAEVPLKRQSELLTKVGTTLKNTLSWQLSASAIRSVTSLFSQAISYSKQLNTSLNDIRIVTGKSVSEMDAFAEKANKAAQALSTTTTEYTKAALIAYQQGLDDSEVEARTNVIIKMANVTGETAREVSDQMTAVWNNFYDGSKSLEYYSDVLTALGAATASSTSEISTGLEKFAAIADTVGLSYEYAASALATVTATTRQSADVVGTAFKTLFARIQQLSLGETLEDGVTLGKYTEALNAVGVNILDTKGQLKDMDTILEEMASKWNLIDSAQKVALAQTVAGTRQYSQLVALMDNWDFMQENISTATSASGTLEEQQKIYEESWSAATNRIKATLQEIFSSIIDDDAIIWITNAADSVLKVVADIVKSVGGFKAVIMEVINLIVSSLNKEIANGIDNIFFRLISRTKNYKNEIESIREQSIQATVDMFKKDNTPTGTLRADMVVDEAKIQQALLDKQKELAQSGTQLSSIESLMVQARMKDIEVMNEEILASQKLIEKNEILKKSVQDVSGVKGLESQINGIQNATTKGKASKTVRTNINNYNDKLNTFKRSANDNLETALSKAKDFSAMQVISAQFTNRYTSNFENVDQAKAALTELQNMASNMKLDSGPFKDYFNDIKNILGDSSKGLTDYQEVYNKVINQFSGDLPNFSGTEFAKSLDELIKSAGTTGQSNAVAGLQNLKDSAEQLYNSFAKSGGQLGEFNTQTASGKANLEALLKILPSLQGELITFGQIASQSLQTISLSLTSLQSLINSVSQVKDALNGEGDTLSALISLSYVAMSAMRVFNSIQTLLTMQTKKHTQAKRVETVATNDQTKAKLAEVVASNLYLLVVGAIILVVWGLIEAYKVMNANSPEGQLKKATKAAADTSKALEKTTSRVEELKSAFDVYNEITDTLNDLTVGTEEWNDAISDVNQTVLELLSTYPELASLVNETGQAAITRNSSGQLEIADWAMEQMQKQADIDLAVATLANNTMQARKSRLAIENQINELKNEVSPLAFFSDRKNYVIDGQSYGIEVPHNKTKSFSDIMYAHSNEIVGDTVSEVKNSMLDILKEETKNENFKGDEAFDSYLTKIATALIFNENSEQIEKLNQELEENTRALKIQNEEIARNAIGDFNEVQSSNYSNEIISGMGNFIAQKTEEAYDYLKDTAYGTEGVSKATGVNDFAKEFFEKYAKATGLTNYDLTDTTGTDNNRKYIYTTYDENGEATEVTVTLEAMMQAIASYMALNNEVFAAGSDYTELSEATKELIKQFNILGNSADLADHALLDLVTSGTLENSSAAEVGDLMTKIGRSYIATGYYTSDGGFSTFTPSENDIDKYLKENGITEENALERTGKTYEEFKAELVKQIEDYNNTIQDIMSGMSSEYSKATTEAYKDAAAADSDITITQQRAIAASMGRVAQKFGDEGVKELSELYQEAGNNAGDMAEAISGIDWSTAEVSDVKEALTDAGLSADILSDEKFQHLIDVMDTVGISADDAASRISSLEDTFKNSEDFMQITEDEYNNVLTDELRKFFVPLANGDYELSADISADEAEEVSNKVIRQFYLKGQEGSAEKLTNLEKAKEITDEYESFDEFYKKSNSFGKINFLYDMGAIDAGQRDAYNSKISLGTLSSQDIEEINDLLAQQRDNWNSIDQQIENVSKKIENADLTYFYTFDDATKMEVAYQKKLEEYEGNAEKTEKLKIDYIKARTRLRKLENDERITAYGLDKEEIALTAEYYEKTLGMSEDIATTIAIRNAKINSGLEDLKSNIETLSSGILSGNEANKAGLIAQLQQIMQTVFDYDEEELENIPNAFYESAENLELMEKAANGDIDAYDKLVEIAREYQKAAIIKLGVNESSKTELETELTNLEKYLDTSKYQVGVTIDEEEFQTSANNILKLLKYNYEAWTKAMKGMGFEQEYVVVDYREVPVGYSSNGGTITTAKIPIYNWSWVPTGTGSSTISPSLGGNTSGSTSEDKDIEPDDNRYLNVENKINNLATAYERLEKEKELAMGKDYSEIIQEENENIKERIRLTEEEIALAKQYSYTDYDAMKALGLNPEYDSETWALTNEEEMRDLASAELNAAKEAWNNSSKSDADDKVLDAAEKLYDDRIKAIEKYVKDIETATDKTNEELDLKLQELENRRSLAEIAQNDEKYTFANYEAQVNSLTAAFSKLEKKKEQVFGGKYLDYLDEEIANLEEQEALAKEQVKHAESLANSQSEAWTELTKGVPADLIQWDEDTWAILNPEEVNRYITENYSATEAEIYKGWLEKYTESAAQWAQAKEDEAEAARQKAEKDLEKITYAIEYQIEINDSGLERLDYLLQQIDEDAYSAAESIALMLSQFNLKNASLAQNKSGITQILGEANAADFFASGMNVNKLEGYGITASQREAILGYVSAIYSLSSELTSIYESAFNKLGQTIEKTNEEFDSLEEKLEYSKELLSSFKDIVDIVGQETLGITDDLMAELSKQQVEITKANVANSKNNLDTVMAQRRRLQTAYEQALESGNEIAAKYYKEQLDDLDSVVMEAENKVLSALQDSLDAITEAFKEGIENALDELDKALYTSNRYSGTEEIQEAFERQQTLSEATLKDYEKTYQFTKLINTITKSMEETSNIKNKQELAGLVERINKLQESGAKVTQYDVDNYQRQYDLMLAIQALEDAKNAKSQVRLTRDKYGNYGYTYAADEDTILEAQQKVLDAQYEITKADEERAEELIEKILQNRTDLKSAIAELDPSSENYTDQVTELVDFYRELEQQLFASLQSFANSSERTENLNSIVKNILGYDSIGELLENGIDQQKVIEAAESLHNTYKQNISDTFTQAGIDATNASEAIQEALDGVSLKVAEVGVESQEMAIILAKSFDDSLSALKDFITEATPQIEKLEGSWKNVGIERYKAIGSANTTITSYTDDNGIYHADIKTEYPSEMATGGYTGEWGKSGKLAVLHEKELVLNKQDTVNLLDSIELLDHISSIIDANSYAAKANFAYTADTIAANDKVVKQEVLINADFPNVTDHNEIEIALNELINRASQHI